MSGLLETVAEFLRTGFADLVSHNHSRSFLEIYAQAPLLVTVVVAVCVIFLFGIIREAIADVELIPYLWVRLVQGLFIMPVLFLAGAVLALVSADFSLRGIEAFQHVAPEVAALSGPFLFLMVPIISLFVSFWVVILIGRTVRRCNDWFIRWIGQMIRNTRNSRQEPRPFVLYLRNWASDVDVRYVRASEMFDRRHRVDLGALMGAESFSLNELIYRSSRYRGLGFESVGGVRGAVTGPKRTIADDKWKALVSDLLDRSSQIFIMPSSNAGTLWELQQIVERNLLSKTLVIIPPDRFLFHYGRRRREQRAAFRQRLNDALRAVGCEELPTQAGFYRFDQVANRLVGHWLAGYELRKSGGSKAYTFRLPAEVPQL